VVSILIAIAVGLVIGLSIPASLITWKGGWSESMLAWVILLDTTITAPVWIPLAIVASTCAFYYVDAKLAAQAGLIAPSAFPVWKILRAAVLLHLVLALLIIADTAVSSYRTNNVCEPGDHIIQTEADAIKQARIRISRAHFEGIGRPDYPDFSLVDNCCQVTRSRTGLGIIVWEVSLHGETNGEATRRRVSALMRLSNCGVVFGDESYFSIE
jgi:hypothetical protein